MLADRVEFLFESFHGFSSFAVKEHLSALHDTKWSIRVGTACSGIDVAVTALEMVCGHLALPMEHVFSCDIDPNVQKFIMTVHCPRYLFSDCTHLRRAVVYDLNSKMHVPLPEVVRVEVALLLRKSIVQFNIP